MKIQTLIENNIWLIKNLAEQIIVSYGVYGVLWSVLGYIEESWDIISMGCLSWDKTVLNINTPGIRSI